jgi:hypothetical protein
MVAAKPECSIAELREVKRKADKGKIFRGIQPRSSDFRSQLNCNFKSYELYLFFLCTFPRGIEPLSLQCWGIIPVTRVPRPGFFLIFFHTPQRESPNSIQQNRIRRPQLRISSGERNQRDCEYIPHRILLGLSADTLFAATRCA